MKVQFEGMTPLLQVFDMPTSIRFYRDVLGFDVAGTSPARSADDFDWALIRRDGAHLMLNTAYDFGKRPDRPVATRTAAHRDTGLFFSCRDLDAIYAHLQGHGVSVKPPQVAPYGMSQLWAEDPDGYVICFQWPVA